MTAGQKAAETRRVNRAAKIAEEALVIAAQHVEAGPPKLTMPTVHLNGTSVESLLDDTCAAEEAIRHALEVLAKAGPNGRDYYPQGPAAFGKADDEHGARCEHLRIVLRELERIAEHLNDERNARAERIAGRPHP